MDIYKDLTNHGFYIELLAIIKIITMGDLDVLKIRVCDNRPYKRAYVGNLSERIDPNTDFEAEAISELGLTVGSAFGRTREEARKKLNKILREKGSKKSIYSS